MKQRLLLMVLTLGMLSINVSAQKKEYKVEDDGFEWYLVESRDKTTYIDYYGAQDKYGNTIIPTNYNQLFYFNGFFQVRKGHGSNNEKWGIMDKQGNLIVPVEYDANELLPLGKGQFRYIQAIRGNHMSIYNMYGKCIIPFSRGYNQIFLRHEEDGEDNIYYECFHGDTKYDYKSNDKRKYSICDASGKVVFTTKKECENVFVINDVQRKKYAIVRDGIYFVDKNDNILLESRGFTIGSGGKVDISAIKLYKNRKAVRSLTQVEKNKVLQNGNLLMGNKEYFTNNIRSSGNRMDHSTSASSNTSSNSSSNNNNSGNKTTTVVVEHHRDPMPVQEWRACWACGGMGTMGCDNCGGSGTVYIGDRLHRCSRCNTRGVIPCNICYGNKGQYITVYR